MFASEEIGVLHELVRRLEGHQRARVVARVVRVDRAVERVPRPLDVRALRACGRGDEDDQRDDDAPDSHVGGSCSPEPVAHNPIGLKKHVS